MNIQKKIFSLKIIIFIMIFFLTNLTYASIDIIFSHPLITDGSSIYNDQETASITQAFITSEDPQNNPCRNLNFFTFSCQTENDFVILQSSLTIKLKNIPENKNVSVQIKTKNDDFVLIKINNMSISNIYQNVPGLTNINFSALINNEYTISLPIYIKYKYKGFGYKNNYFDVLDFVLLYESL